METKETKDYKEERFEFTIYVNDNIICKRNFRIFNFIENSMNTLEFKETVDSIVKLIDDDLKSKSRVYTWCYFNPNEKDAFEEFAGKGGDALRYMDAIPADNRGKRQATLRKLENTMYDLLDGLTLEMPLHGLDEQGLQDTFTPRDIPAPVAINSTIDYMNRCNEDCTVFGGWG